MLRPIAWPLKRILHQLTAKLSRISSHVSPLYKALIASIAIIHFCSEFAGVSIWFGGSDAAVEGTWVHTDGTPVIYSNWGPGQPDNYGNEDCSEILPNTNWNDIPCYIGKPSICEKPSYKYRKLEIFIIKKVK